MCFLGITALWQLILGTYKILFVKQSHTLFRPLSSTYNQYYFNLICGVSTSLPWMTDNGLYTVLCWSGFWSIFEGCFECAVKQGHFWGQLQSGTGPSWKLGRKRPLRSSHIFSQEKNNRNTPIRFCWMHLTALFTGVISIDIKIWHLKPKASRYSCASWSCWLIRGPGWLVWFSD